MKKLFISALMLTGMVAMAQETTTQTQAETTTKAQPAQTTQTTTPARTEAKPAAKAQTAQPAQQPVAIKKTEATVKEEKADVKKAEPSKKSN
ncbi:hypothetical protein [uncultured Flavobacterium sp.]|uniref:hypothetical protein n=1 Tax=uncultured Flavobacterium sp. TaxID=165435 RepID=UPI0025FC549A|nr:hypothetical protein [uncultured Flavobacterium sp.]